EEPGGRRGHFAGGVLQAAVPGAGLCLAGPRAAMAVPGGPEPVSGRLEAVQPVRAAAGGRLRRRHAGGAGPVGPRGRPAGVPADSPSPPLLRGLHPPGDRAAPGGDGAHGENAAEAGPGRPAEHMGGELMNRYHESMEHCAPPPELEEQLREAVLSAEPEPQARTAVYRPRGFFRKALLAAVLIVTLTVSAGAVVIANWDAILASRFGEWAASTPMGQAAFQEVYVTSVCDDVTLTVRQALVSEKSVYLVLDYQLPDTVDREAVQRADQSDDDFIYPPEIGYYLTGDFSWADFKAADLKRWHGLDWSDFT
ncbi:hypothetical protein OHPBIL_OHPBIL_02520, partial [Dysosmobacter welbionis]